MGISSDRGIVRNPASESILQNTSSWSITVDNPFQQERKEVWERGPRGTPHCLEVGPFLHLPWLTRSVSKHRAVQTQCRPESTA